LIACEAALAKISWRLAYSYRAFLLENKHFEEGEAFADKLADKFMELYFGKHPAIIAFARIAIGLGRKPLAMALNDAVRVLGGRIDAPRVIQRIVEEHDPFGFKTQERHAALQRFLASTAANPEHAQGLLAFLGGALSWKSGWLRPSEFHLRLGGVNLYFAHYAQVRDWIVLNLIPHSLLDHDSDRNTHLRPA
jgi:hypothetical protein